MKKVFLFLTITAFAAFFTQAQNTYDWATESSNGYTYKYVKNDPFKTRFYTLKNGFTVIMGVNKAEPRLQTIIATKAGSNTDPANHTGLAHYLEHMVFKGSHDFGSKDWAKESVLLDSVSTNFE